MKQFKGTVITKSGIKTIRVEVESIKVHPRYGKRYRVHKNYLVHDGSGSKNVGDQVTFVETRPISKRKHFKVTE
ncbi:30S ribosomal protein S17 [Candidatus Berkelbacteria bacterium]|nr:30S ribosomal protein S17 [Candidatus Berkelbacteria bacterium]